ncbi:MAG TPA: hypothetical protein VHM65_01940 [Candidatus Lustribacter sp.]|nr:hypothetical protein [Candidatus Lustribacter sp.]
MFTHLTLSDPNPDAADPEPVGWAGMNTMEHTVTEADTAEHLGSGDLPVLGTPRLINWAEVATVAAAAEALDEDHTTVGTLVKFEHVRASPVGATITITCSKPVNDGRRLIFHVRVADSAGDELAHGEIHRAVVDRQRFMARLDEAGEPPVTSPTPDSRA